MQMAWRVAYFFMSVVVKVMGILVGVRRGALVG